MCPSALPKQTRSRLFRTPCGYLKKSSDVGSFQRGLAPFSCLLHPGWRGTTSWHDLCQGRPAYCLKTLRAVVYYFLKARLDSEVPGERRNAQSDIS